jgi:hypothetical protein
MINNSSLTVQNGKLTNNGTLSATAGTVVVKGNASTANSAIDGTGTSSFNHLTVNKSSNNAQLGQNISVSGYLTLSSGGLELAAGNVDFGTTGSLQSETETNRVQGTGGYLRAVATLNAPSSANPANLGAQISSAANFGSTEIKRSHQIFTVVGSSIARGYDIQPTTNTGLNATLRAHYFDAEINGNNESTMVLWRSTDNGATWTAQTTATSRDIAANWVEKTGIDAFSSWTTANPGALPIELLSFTGKNKGSYNLLEWATASEVNNTGFEIERSREAISFEKIGFVTSKSSEANTYTFKDENLEKGVLYYRLKQIDTDGKYSYSPVISIRTKGTETIFIYPNPNKDGIFRIDGKIIADQKMTVLNAVGQEVEGSIYQNQIDLRNLPAGIYFLNLEGESFRLIKE